MGTELKEILGPFNALLFKEETMSPIFCKPKLIPLKTITMEKLEKMQQDAIDKLKALENPQPDTNGSSDVPEDPHPSGEQETNIWKADD